ncbi:MAG: cobalamin-independent methionine synthase II family protein [Chloroflexi bacterium]|nr:cobalamin-independent methionine synthase II family protein [Chloroflexota bacterium]MBV9131850.1 cobalamin-independent methionine synthase II family protein [Chloroflexota bacterium]
MKRSTDRILTTFAGSLIRPPEVLALGPETDETTRKQTLQRAVADVVHKQAEVGVDVVSDGEFGKSSWFTYVMDRLGGFEVRPAERPKIGVRGKDEARYPDFWQAVGPQGGRAYRRHVCVAPITYIGKSLMQRDVGNLLSALEGVHVEGAFLPVVAPTSISVDHANEYYPSHERYLEAVADALHEEYRTITDAGLIVQLDDAILTHWFDRITDEGGDYRKWVAQQVEIINHALRGIPQEQVRYHVCWGSWPGPHTSDVPLRTIVDLILNINAQGFSIEAANPRHEWEWTVWQDVKLPDGKILIPGVISHAISHVEHPELIAQRLRRFANLVGQENVIASSDCGFAQGAGTQRQVPSIVWAKLGALAEGARLASESRSTPD